MSTTDKAPGKTPTTVRRRITFDWRRDIIYVGFVAVVIVFSILLRDQGFISTTSLMNILRQTAIVTVIAVGMTYVIAAAEIDLSGLGADGNGPVSFRACAGHPRRSVRGRDDRSHQRCPGGFR